MPLDVTISNAVYVYGSVDIVDSDSKEGTSDPECDAFFKDQLCILEMG
jgi:hypothetical protein